MHMKQRSTRRMSVQSPLVFYLITLLTVFIISLLYVISFAPLLALIVFEKGSFWQYLAFLCPIALIFFILPLRFSFAQALTSRYHHIPFSLRTAFNPSLYGEKLAEGLLYALHIIKWMLPLLAAGGVLYYLYTDTDVFTLVKGVTDFGAAVTAVWNGFIHFIAGIFGSTKDVLPGGIVEGVFAILGILCACLLFLLWGIVRNSAFRYIWAEATELDKNPRYEARRSLRGRRFAQLGVALINLVLLAPALIVLYQIIEPKQAIEDIAMQFADAIVAETLAEITIPYGKLAVVFFGCYLPFLPLRRIITAHFATVRIRKQVRAPEVVAAGGSEQEQIPLLYEDKPTTPMERRL